MIDVHLLYFEQLRIAALYEKIAHVWKDFSIVSENKMEIVLRSDTGNHPATITIKASSHYWLELKEPYPGENMEDSKKYPIRVKITIKQDIRESSSHAYLYRPSENLYFLVSKR